MPFFSELTSFPCFCLFIFDIYFLTAIYSLLFRNLTTSINIFFPIFSALLLLWYTADNFSHSFRQFYNALLIIGKWSISWEEENIWSWRRLRLFNKPFEPVNEDAVKCSTEDCVDQAANVCRPLTAIRKRSKEDDKRSLLNHENWTSESQDGAVGTLTQVLYHNSSFV